jgi:hypothetical protein
MRFSGSHFFMRLGQHFNRNLIGKFKLASKGLEIGYLVRQLGFKMGDVKNWAEDRTELFDMVGREVGDREVLYLEFGVHEGEATRYWSKLLTNPNSKLHGFDSFEGLPEDWHSQMPKGHFSTNGRMPVIDDERVQFFKGWFDQTLPAYQVPEHEVLVLNFDADLYSSTLCALQNLAPHIVPGTYLYFDEFPDAMHELRAFAEFCSSSPRKFVLRGATTSLISALFQCVQ